MKKIKLLLAAMAAMVTLGANAWDGSEGKVYLKNVGSGLYWGAGDHLNWGTRAMLVENPEYVTLHLANGVYTLESQVSNGGTAYYFNGDYMDNGSPVSMTIEQSGDYWTIVKSDNSETYGYDGSSTVLGKAVDTTTDNGKWIIRTENEMLADIANGTVTSPKDATFLFLDPGFGRNNRNVGSWTVSDDCTNKNLNGANPNNYGCGESYHSKFTISQSATVPNGVYKVSGRAFYRQDGTDNEHIPYLEANGQKSSFPLMNTGINSMKAAQESFIDGNWNIDPMIVEVTTGTLEIKMVCEQTSLWCILDGFELEYYGEITLADLPLDDAYVTSYNNALSAAQAYQSQDMFDADKTALNTAITNNTFDATQKKQGEVDDVLAAISALNEASSKANVAVTQYTNYNTAASLVEGNTNVDLTSLIGNAGFESTAAYALVADGWTNEGVGLQGQTNSGFDGYRVGDVFAERWVASGQIGSFKTSQELTLPAGIYEISVIGTFNGNGASLFVDDATTAITDAATYKLLFQATDKQKVTFGLQAVSPTGSWFKADDVKLTYVGNDFPAYTLVSGKMNSTTSAAQTSAETTFNSSKTVANYNALLAAISAAQASKDAYAKTAEALTNANAIKNNFNFATTTATTTFADAIADIQSEYDANTLSDADAANAANLGTVLVGWHPAHASENYTIAEAYMQSAWTDGELNDWSTEGDSDGSNFHIPFFQNWTGDGNSLAEGTTYGQLTSLPNGLYQVSALVRVRLKDGQEDGTVPTGITLQVNDGEAVNACSGTNVDGTQFYLGTITAEGLVKDGNLNAVFNRTSSNNVSWLSFKDIAYTKVRDLTAEEMAVTPTAIALYNGETEVTSAIALDETTTTVTLTPSYTPATATADYITWETSDASVATVADGVVTAVSTGTATITVTSTLDSNVKAQANVNVTFPESEVPTYVNNGATRTVYNFGPNLIKNGVFEYPDAFYGWTSANDFSSEITSGNGFSIKTDGEGNSYLYAATNGGGSAASSLGTAWEIEEGKTYMFAYDVKKEKSADNYSYLVTSLTNSKGDETSALATPTSIDDDWTTISYTFTNTDNYKYLQIKFRWLSGQWGFRNFYLCEVLADPTTEGNVQYALDAIPTANIGTGAFQYSQDAIDAANALVQGTATVADVENAYEALTTINEPTSGQLFNVILTYGGWTYDQKAMTYLAGDRSDMGGYNIKYQAAANTNLAQAFTFTKVSGNNYKMSQIDANGDARYISTGVPYSGNTSQIRTTTLADKALVVTVIPTATEGVWNLKNTEANNYIGSQDAGVYTVNSHIDFNIVETTKPSITINTTAAGWGTTMLPFAVTSLPSGVKAYTCAAVDGTTLTLTEVDALEANKSYIIEGAWNETLEGDAQGTALTYTEGLLTGVYASQLAPVDSYVLQNNADGVGFYKVAESKQPTVGANRAYLTVPAAAGGVKAFYFNTETAIKSVMSGLQSGDIYDLSGRKVSKMQKGNVYIVNGQKVAVK